MNTEPKQRNVVVTRVFDAPVEQVWKAWVEPGMVRQWWGPESFTCPLAEMDFREGGTSLVCMRAPQEFGGQDLYNTWTYEEIVPMRRLVYILRFTDKDGKAFDPAEMGLPPGVPKEVRNINTFKDLGIEARFVDASDPQNFAKQIDAKHALFLFDSCFSGTFFKMRAAPESISLKTAQPVHTLPSVSSPAPGSPGKT